MYGNACFSTILLSPFLHNIIFSPTSSALPPPTPPQFCCFHYLHHNSAASPPATPTPPHFYCFHHCYHNNSIAFTTAITTILLFSPPPPQQFYCFHHRHHDNSIVFTTATTTILLFHHRHHDNSIVSPPPPPHHTIIAYDVTDVNAFLRKKGATSMHTCESIQRLAELFLQKKEPNLSCRDYTRSRTGQTSSNRPAKPNRLMGRIHTP